MQTLAFSEYGERRARLLAALGEDAVALIPAAEPSLRNRDVDFYFRQDSDFYYLTGFAEPYAWLVLLPGRQEGQVVMFCQPRDKEREIWDGYRAGPEGCMERFGADQAFNLDQLDSQLPQLLANRQRLYVDLGQQPERDKRVLSWLQQTAALARQGMTAPQQIQSLSSILHEMRLFKSAAEIEMMRAAGQLSALGHRAAMQQCRPGMWEYQLEAAINHVFMQHGSRWPAYNAIVGGGANACVLHYNDNNRPLQEGDLVLIDAGCELDYYAGDITRTFPVNGRFSAEQRALYEVVLHAQRACIELVRPGTPWDQVHEASTRLLTEGLLALGLLQGELNELVETGAYKRFYMHRIGHWLGMDVHDVGSYRQANGAWRELAAGMVMTVEPGLYIAPDDESVAPRWRGLGIRIEDDVLVTAEGPEVLTAAVPTAIDEIEALMQGG